MDKVKTFLDEIFNELKRYNININQYQVDHIAYRTESKQEYEKIRDEIKKYGEIYPEAIIRDRRIAVYRLYKPIVYEKWKIEAIELLEPADNNDFISGWEHIEVVVDDLQQVMNTYTNLDWNTNALSRINNPELSFRINKRLGIKFHTISILEARELQVKTGVL